MGNRTQVSDNTGVIRVTGSVTLSPSKKDEESVHRTMSRMIGGKFHKKVELLPGERVLKQSGAELAHATGESDHRGILCLTSLRLLWVPHFFLGAMVDPLVVPLTAIKSCSIGRPKRISIFFLETVPIEIDVAERQYTVYPYTRWGRFGSEVAEQWRKAIEEARAAVGQTT